MIKLRLLEKKDAPFMIEWMHDEEIQKCFIKDMLGISLEDAEHFCEENSCYDDNLNGNDRHFAIVDDADDEYLGTISLKEIDLENRNCLFAISTRKKAHGTGAAFVAAGLILDKAFNEYGLNRVYLNVRADNARAFHFYEKCGFKFEGEFRNHLYVDGEYVSWKWYSVLAEEYNKSRFGI